MSDMITPQQLHYWMVLAGRGVEGRCDDGADSAFISRLGAEHAIPVTGADFYGTVTPGKAVPPREEGGALPSLGRSGTVHDRAYTLASRAWMHANCDEDPKSREKWRKILDMCREGKYPTELL